MQSIFWNRIINVAQRKIDEKKNKKTKKEKKKEKYKLWRISRSLIDADDKETSYLMFLLNELLTNQGQKTG